MVRGNEFETGGRVSSVPCCFMLEKVFMLLVNITFLLLYNVFKKVSWQLIWQIVEGVKFSRSLDFTIGVNGFGVLDCHKGVYG